MQMLLHSSSNRHVYESVPTSNHVSEAGGVNILFGVYQNSYDFYQTNFMQKFQSFIFTMTMFSK